MNRIAALEIFDDELKFVTYYTVRLIENDVKDELSETEKFYEIYDNEAHPYFSEFDIIGKVVDAMGYSENGAEAHFFRFEDAASALPPGKKVAERLLETEIATDSQLRLYAIRLRNEVVVLLNGGVKTEIEALNCPNVRVHFRFAQAIAKAIDELIIDKSIRIEGKKIINETGEDEILLYFK